MKKFNKLNFLALLGFVDRKFNYDTNCFEKSTSALLCSYLALVLRMTFALRLIFSVFFDRQDPIQLVIGDLKRVESEIRIFQTVDLSRKCL